jgi:hypothetical protein
MMFLLLPAFSSAEVKIILKNGRSVIVDSCKEAGAKLICDMEGGTVEFDRQDIESTRDVKVQRLAPADEAPTDEQGGDEEKPVEDKGELKEGAGKDVKSLTQEQISRLDRIRERKEELKIERERVNSRREELRAAFEKAKSAYVPPDQAAELNRQNAALEEEIRNFNEEAKRLNEEERAIIGAGETAK